MAHSDITVAGLIERLWIAPDNAEWTPKTNVLVLADLKKWMDSVDLEVLGFVDALIHDRRFRIEPPLLIADYVRWAKHYYGRCFRENPDGEWSASSYSAGWDLVGVVISLWDDDTVPRSHLLELKNWLADLYKAGDERLRTCIVHATLEHVCERKPIRRYFSDWLQDPILAPAYNEACLWDRKTRLAADSGLSSESPSSE